MYCYKSCLASVVILVSMVYMLFVDKTNILVNVLTPDQLATYKKITKERRNHMLIGYLLGLLLSVAVVLTVKNKTLQVCYTVLITYVTSYFYYTLVPKSDYMILHLTADQHDEWLAVYLKMKNHYHVSLLLGILFVALATYAY